MIRLATFSFAFLIYTAITALSHASVNTPTASATTMPLAAVCPTDRGQHGRGPNGSSL